MGAQARNDASNLPPGVFCLFPGYWSDSGASAFAASCIKAPLGVHERIARSLLIKQFTPKKLRDEGPKADSKEDFLAVIESLPLGIQLFPRKLTCPLKINGLEDVFPIEIVPF